MEEYKERTFGDTENIRIYIHRATYFLSGLNIKFFDILAYISDSYLRLTTAHTQAKKTNITAA
jgi:hypothetical protein